MRFMCLKYAGGSGWPASTWRTKSSSRSVRSPQFVRFSYASVVTGIAPRFLPHAEPGPWPGQSIK